MSELVQELRRILVLLSVPEPESDHSEAQERSQRQSNCLERSCKRSFFICKPLIRNDRLDVDREWVDAKAEEAPDHNCPIRVREVAQTSDCRTNHLESNSTSEHCRSLEV